MFLSIVSYEHVLGYLKQLHFENEVLPQKTNFAYETKMFCNLFILKMLRRQNAQITAQCLHSI